MERKYGVCIDYGLFDNRLTTSILGSGWLWWRNLFYGSSTCMVGWVLLSWEPRKWLPVLIVDNDAREPILTLRGPISEFYYTGGIWDRDLIFFKYIVWWWPVLVRGCQGFTCSTSLVIYPFYPTKISSALQNKIPNTNGLNNCTQFSLVVFLNWNVVYVNFFIAGL